METPKRLIPQFAIRDVQMIGTSDYAANIYSLNRQYMMVITPMGETRYISHHFLGVRIESHLIYPQVGTSRKHFHLGRPPLVGKLQC